MKDYYEILEVHPRASQDVIKKAYVVLAKKYHPDVTKVAANIARSRMMEINEAYSVLSNLDERLTIKSQEVGKKKFPYW